MNKYEQLEVNNPFTKEITAYNRQFYRFSAVLKILIAEGVEFLGYARVKNTVYLSKNFGPWNKIKDEEVDFDEILFRIQDSYEDADYCYQLRYNDKTIVKSETEMNFFLNGIWNIVNLVIQQNFNTWNALIDEIIDTPISRALAGEPKEFKLNHVVHKCD